jgi:hypothetical protein
MYLKHISFLVAERVFSTVLGLESERPLVPVEHADDSSDMRMGEGPPTAAFNRKITANAPHWKEPG